MLNIDKSDLQRIAGAMIGAIILTTVSVGAAIGPARAVETNPVYVQADTQAPDRAHG